MIKLARLVSCALVVAAALPVSSPSTFAADPGSGAFARQLAPVARKQFEDWIAAQARHNSALDRYWGDVEEKRAARRAKKKRGEALQTADYVQNFPPEYKGPALSAELAKRWDAHRTRGASPRPARRGILTVADALVSARKYYGFEPARIPEREFKRRYAREALTLGLTKTQVLRVYALETGGQGTADMQAGINPLTKKGTAISTALGYAQLLNANSVSELSVHGDKFLDRLRALAGKADAPAREGELKSKIGSLRRMLTSARSIPYKWDRHVAYASTAKGIGIHAINLDGDIGPWLQVVKLAGLKQMAEKAGRPNLSGSEIELMNLAGPGTGLEMMQPAGLKAPTTNFFARAAYGRNTVVRGRTSAELLVELDRRMDFALQKPGAQEFAAVFDEVIEERHAAR